MRPTSPRRPDKHSLIRQAVAAWILLFVSSTIYATIATVLTAFGSGAGQRLVISLALSGACLVCGHVMLYRRNYLLPLIFARRLAVTSPQQSHRENAGVTMSVEQRLFTIISLLSLLFCVAGYLALPQIQSSLLGKATNTPTSLLGKATNTPIQLVGTVRTTAKPLTVTLVGVSREGAETRFTFIAVNDGPAYRASICSSECRVIDSTGESYKVTRVVVGGDTVSSVTIPSGTPYRFTVVVEGLPGGVQQVALVELNGLDVGEPMVFRNVPVPYVRPIGLAPPGPVGGRAIRASGSTEFIGSLARPRKGRRLLSLAGSLP